MYVQVKIWERKEITRFVYGTTVSRKFEFTYEKKNYSAKLFNSANMLQMEHGWDENLATVWSDIAFLENISDMVFVVDERSDYENDNESSDDERPEKSLSDSSASEESVIENY